MSNDPNEAGGGGGGAAEAKRIVTQKLVRNGWPEDEPMKILDESLLAYSTGTIDDENEYTVWHEWRLDGKIVKRGAHVTLKKNVAAEGVAAMFG